MDITKNIRLIETLKNNILMDIAKLHENLAKNSRDSFEEREELSSLIIIDTYLLFNKLGLNYQNQDDLIIKKLRCLINDEKNIFHKDYLEFLRHMNK